MAECDLLHPGLRRQHRVPGKPRVLDAGPVEEVAVVKIRRA